MVGPISHVSCSSPPVGGADDAGAEKRSLAGVPEMPTMGKLFAPGAIRRVFSSAFSEVYKRNRVDQLYVEHFTGVVCIDEWEFNVWP